MVGGGARSSVWCQIFADVMDRTIKQVEDPLQANARGAAFIASVGLGHIQFDDIPGLTRFSGVFLRTRQPCSLRRALRGIPEDLQEQQRHVRAAEHPDPLKGVSGTNRPEIAEARFPDRSGVPLSRIRSDGENLAGLEEGLAFSLKRDLFPLAGNESGVCRESRTWTQSVPRSSTVAPCSTLSRKDAIRPTSPPSRRPKSKLSARKPQIPTARPFLQSPASISRVEPCGDLLLPRVCRTEPKRRCPCRSFPGSGTEHRSSPRP